MLGLCAIFIALGGIADALGAIGPLFGFSVFGTIAKLLWLITIVYMVFLLFNLDFSMRWARKNGLAARARDIRRAERAAEESQRMVSRAQEVYVPPPPPGAQRSLLAELDGDAPIPISKGKGGGELGSKGTPQPYPQTFHGPGIDPPDDVKPYTLDDE
jgi:uncharacterized membrane protein